MWLGRVVCPLSQRSLQTLISALIKLEDVPKRRSVSLPSRTLAKRRSIAA
jgi:hypothetical protein